MDKPIGKTKRAIQAEATKRRICEAAVELMEKNGFNNMTIQEINERAGVSVGTFYHYFSSKDDVFFELYRKADEYFEKIVKPYLDNNTLNIADRIALYFRFYARFNVSNGLEYVSQLYSTKNKLFISRDRFMYRMLENLVADGLGSGELLSPMEPAELADSLLVFGRGIVFDWCLHEGAYDLEEIIVSRIYRFLNLFRKGVALNPG